MICNKKRNRILSIILIIVLMLSSVLSTSVFADNDKKATMKMELHQDKIYRGQIIRVDLVLDFEEELVLNGGIMAYRAGIKFDPEVLEMIDPISLQPIVFNDNGLLADGLTLYKFGEIGTEKSFTAKYNSAEETIILFYGATSEESYVFESGAVVQLAFRAHTDLEINNSLLSKLDLVISEISVANVITDEEGNTSLGSPIVVDVTAEDKNLNILPPFELSNVSSQKQNSTLYLTGRSIIGTDSDMPLTAIIIDSNGNEIAEKDATLSKIRYDVEFELDEDSYPPGRYTIKMIYDNTTATALFDILENEEPYVPPVTEPEQPENPDVNEPSTDNSGTENSGNDNNNENSGSSDKDDNTNTGTTKPNDSTTKPSDNGGYDINLGGTDKLPAGNQGTTDKKPEEKEDVHGVIYPSDIDGHWASDNIKYVYDNSLMNGYEDGTFGPDNNITRAEFVTVMARLHGYTEDETAAAKFTDVADHWAKGYIGALASMGIVGGVSDTEFAPDENITREQIAAILTRALALTHDDISVKYADDAQISDWAYDSVYSVFEAGYMKGDTNNNFNPLNSATRAEVATIIYRLHFAK